MNFEVQRFPPRRWSNRTRLRALCTIFTAFDRWSVKENPSDVKKKKNVPLIKLLTLFSSRCSLLEAVCALGSFKKVMKSDKRRVWFSTNTKWIYENAFLGNLPEIIMFLRSVIIQSFSHTGFNEKRWRFINAFIVKEQHQEVLREDKLCWIAEMRDGSFSSWWPALVWRNKSVYCVDFMLL